MATYYVRVDGNDTNAGTGPATNQAWQTITKAVGATGVGVGDTVYIAPGIYRGNFTAGFTNPANEGQRITIAGNPTASLFTGVNAGPVILTNYLTDNVSFTLGDIFSISKNFVTVQDMIFYGWTPTPSPFYRPFSAPGASALKLYRCLFGVPSSNAQKPPILVTINAGSTGFTVDKCVVLNGTLAISTSAHSGAWDTQTVITDNIFIDNCTNSYNSECLSLYSSTSGQFGGVKIVNNYMQGAYGVHIYNALSTAFPSVIQNCYIEASTTAITSDVGNTSAMAQTYNILNAPTSVTNIGASATSKTNAFNPINGSISKIQGWADYPFISALSSLNAGVSAGINTNSPATDLYGTSWLIPATPSINAAEYASYTPSSQYLPTERNASTITIAPGSTSQSIELYLGATGLTFATSGLAAYYVRNQSAPVAITLVTQTATGAWSSGGFAEISSSLVPGVYRLDVPNAAFAANASDVTIVVRGAAGTNGAVLTVNLIAAPTDAVLVRMGPFEVKADGLGASDPLDIQKGAQHGIDIQCVDNNGAGIDITSATVTAKIYNSGATLVSTLTCTATYAADGRATFTLTTAVTNTPGTYTATITRTTGASDTQVFGPLRIYVRDI